MAIEKVADGFQCWSGGCGIGKVDNIGDARKKLFLLHAREEVVTQLEVAKKSVERLSKLDDQLGGDIFNLGMFRKWDK